MADPEVATDAPDDISASINAAITEHGEPGKPVEAPKVEAKPEPVAKPAAEEKPEPAKAGERQRGPDGKFLKADSSEEPELALEPKPKVAAKPEGTEPEPAEVKLDVAPEIPSVLARLSAVDKEKFNGLPQEAKDILAGIAKQQNADYTRKTQAIAQLKNEYEPVEQMFAPHRDIMRQKGFTPKSLITAWFNVENDLMSGNGAKVIKGLVDGYKLDPRQIAQVLGISGAPQRQTNGNGQAHFDDAGNVVPAVEQGQQVQLPPEVQARLDELARRQDAIDNANRARNDHEAAAVRRARVDAEQKAETDIETFKSADDGKGNMLHPHFEDVEDAMTTIALGYANRKQPIPPLQELYETAVWANPSTRAKLLAADKQAEEEKARKEARDKAARATKAGSSTTGTPGSGQATLKPVERSLREELEANFDAHAT